MYIYLTVYYNADIATDMFMCGQIRLSERINLLRRIFRSTNRQNTRELEMANAPSDNTAQILYENRLNVESLTYI